MKKAKPSRSTFQKAAIEALEELQTNVHEIDQKLDHLIRSLRLHFASHTHLAGRFRNPHDLHNHTLNDFAD